MDFPFAMTYCDDAFRGQAGGVEIGRPFALSCSGKQLLGGRL